MPGKKKISFEQLVLTFKEAQVHLGLTQKLMPIFGQDDSCVLVNGERAQPMKNSVVESHLKFMMSILPAVEPVFVQASPSSDELPLD